MCAFRPSGCMQNDITLTAHAVALRGECFRLRQEITALFHAAHPSDLPSTCSSFTEAGPGSAFRSCWCVEATGPTPLVPHLPLISLDFEGWEQQVRPPERRGWHDGGRSIGLTELLLGIGRFGSDLKDFFLFSPSGAFLSLIGLFLMGLGCLAPQIQSEILK